MRISDWSSDVCSSDLTPPKLPLPVTSPSAKARPTRSTKASAKNLPRVDPKRRRRAVIIDGQSFETRARVRAVGRCFRRAGRPHQGGKARSEEHTSELQSLMRISYAVFCLKKKTTTEGKTNTKH